MTQTGAHNVMPSGFEVHMRLFCLCVHRLTSRLYPIVDVRAPPTSTDTVPDNDLWTYHPLHKIRDVKQVLWERPDEQDEEADGSTRTSLLVQMVEVQGEARHWNLNHVFSWTHRQEMEEYHSDVVKDYDTRLKSIGAPKMLLQVWEIPAGCTLICLGRQSTCSTGTCQSQRASLTDVQR